MRDCKAQPRSFVPGPVYCLDATEGQKNLRDHGFGHTRSQIPNSNDSPIAFAADRHVDEGSLASEANSVTDDILHGASEQFFGAGDRAFFESRNADTPGLRTLAFLAMQSLLYSALLVCAGLYDLYRKSL